MGDKRVGKRHCKENQRGDAQMKNILSHDAPQNVHGKVVYVHAMTNAEKIKFKHSPSRELSAGLVRVGDSEAQPSKQSVPTRKPLGNSNGGGSSASIEKCLRWE